MTVVAEKPGVLVPLVDVIRQYVVGIVTVVRRYYQVYQTHKRHVGVPRNTPAGSYPPIVPVISGDYVVEVEGICGCHCEQVTLPGVVINDK